MTSKNALRETFNQVPELYDQIRPGYPQEILRQVDQYAGLGDGSKVLEVGSGTGLASRYFIERGYNFLGIDLGSNLVAFAQKKFKKFPKVEFVISTFESWNGAPGSTDLILSAQAFHWIDPKTGLAKAAKLLKIDGALALIWNLDESEKTEFWQKSSAIHKRYLPQSSGNQGANLKESYKIYLNSLSNSDHFGGTTLGEHTWSKVYSADEWIMMRNTFSPDLELPLEERKAFHQELRAVIDTLGGSFTRFYRTVCLLARRRG